MAYQNEENVYQSRPNSFGDAAAAARDPNVTQAQGGGPLSRAARSVPAPAAPTAPTFEPPGGNLLMPSAPYRMGPAPAPLSQQAGAGRGFSNPGLADPSQPSPSLSAGAGRGFTNQDWANPSAPPPQNQQQDSAGPPLSAANSFITRQGNSYSGPAGLSGSVDIRNTDGSLRTGGGTVTSLPSGAFTGGFQSGNAQPSLSASAGGFQVSPQNMAAADALSARQQAESTARVQGQGFASRGSFPGSGPVEPGSFTGGFSGIVGGGSGNMMSRTPEQQRRDAETQATSILRPTAERGRSTLAALDAQDLQGARNMGQLDVARTNNDGAFSRAMLEDQGNTQRSALNSQTALTRTGMEQDGALQRTGIEAGSRQVAAQIKALQASRAEQLKTGKEGQQQAKDAQDVYSIYDEAKNLLPKATGSPAGNAWDQTARFFGGSTPGADATAQLKVLQGSLIGKMPKMSGPQSDKDVQLYREMAGQIGDPTVPNVQRMKALDTVKSLHEKYLPQVVDSAGADSLPSGSYFKTPDGQVRRKP